MNPTDTNDTIVREILINAPAMRIFEALTDPRQRLKWWGSEGRFQATHMESDLRPGGVWVMRGQIAAGKPFTVRGEYRSVERPRLLEFTWLPDWPENAPLTVVRFELDEKDGATTVRLTHSGFTTDYTRENYRGWPRILAWLQAFVEKDVAESN